MMDKREEFDDVSAAYGKLNKPEPSPELDQAVLRAAQDELDAAKKTKRGDFWQQWLKPLSTVAALGLCLTVVLQVMNNAPTTIPAAPEAKSKSADLDIVRREAPADPYSVEAPGRVAMQAPAFAEADEAEPAPNFAPQINEMVVAEKRQEESLQDVPASASAYSEREIIVTARKAVMQITLAENALTEWNSGARPAPDVWQAGIAELTEDLDQAGIDQELANLKLASSGVAAEHIDAIADPWVWDAGISWLLDNGEEERAEAEIAKFLKIYPDNDSQRNTQD